MPPASQPSGAAGLVPRALALSRRLQDRIAEAFEEVDGGAFSRSTWTRPAGGGGEMRVLRGRILEKAGVNVSHVWGPSSPIDGRPFEAAGISVIAHPLNPKAPTVHFNLRAFAQYPEGTPPPADSGRASEPSAIWVGGGMDLTPMGFPFPDDTQHFHAACKRALAPFGASFYDECAKAAAHYFFIPHRNRERGVGGIFFDHVASGKPERDFALLESVGERFLEAYLPILVRRLGEPYTAEDRETQLRARGAYVEFNLLYDKGTRFGFESGGNPDAILVSLPPTVQW